MSLQALGLGSAVAGVHGGAAGQPEPASADRARL